MKKVLVTGGCVFIGSHMVDLLLSKKFKVYNIDKHTYAAVRKGYKKKNYKEIKTDLNSTELKNIIKNIKPDYILNFAAESHVDNSISNPRVFLNTNILGTFNLLNCTIKNNLKNTKFIHISTDEVFGSLKKNKNLFNLKSNYDPNSPYSASKAASDHLVRAYGSTYDLKYNVLNCSNNFGPRQHKEKLIPKVISNSLKKKMIPIYGKGHQIRDWIYVKDFCRAILFVLKKSKNKETYLVGSKNEQSNITLVKNICKIMDEMYPKKEPHEKLINFIKDRPGHDFRYGIDNTSIKKLGWKPKYNFKQALYQTIKYYANED